MRFFSWMYVHLIVRNIQAHVVFCPKMNNSEVLDYKYSDYRIIKSGDKERLFLT